MCTILFSYKTNTAYPLILASNRDEFYDRPTAPAGFWEDEPQLLAGRDLKECGTWLGITKSGKIATLTNFRDPRSVRDDAPTRGKLINDFLLNNDAPEEYLQRVKEKAHVYNGFNLIFGYIFDLYYFSNKGGLFQKLSPGLYGLSNALLDTPWPKVERGKTMLGRLVTGKDSVDPEDIFSILADTFLPADDLLPHTGVGLKWERILAPLFVQSPVYGTRFSTVVLVDRNYWVTFIERSFQAGPEKYETRKFEFKLEGTFREQSRTD